MKRLHEDYMAARDALKAAEPSHVEQALEFARLAWRRPLSDDEAQRLRSFYNNMRHELDHPEAMRGLLARILLAPAFLYRVEPVVGASDRSRERIPLSDAYVSFAGSSSSAILDAATAGDDYEIAFTAPSSARGAIAAAAQSAGVPVREIGRVEEGNGVVLLDLDGKAIPVGQPGYIHF